MMREPRPVLARLAAAAVPEEIQREPVCSILDRAFTHTRLLAPRQVRRFALDTAAVTWCIHNCQYRRQAAHVQTHTIEYTFGRTLQGKSVRARFL